MKNDRAAFIRAAFDWFEFLSLDNKKREACASLFLLVRIVGLEKILVLPPSSRRQVTVHRTVTFDWFESLSLTNKKAPLWGAFFVGADDRTRTCTLARWNLNPMSLPIPPHPRIPLQIMNYKFTFSSDFCRLPDNQDIYLADTYQCGSC